MDGEGYSKGGVLKTIVCIKKDIAVEMRVGTA